MLVSEVECHLAVVQANGEARGSGISMVIRVENSDNGVNESGRILYAGRSRTSQPYPWSNQ